MNDDILLEVFRFQMRDQIERWEPICFHWHQLISSSTSWSRRLPLRPVQNLKIVLNGDTSLAECTEYFVQYCGVENIFYHFRPGDNDLRLCMSGAERKSTRPIHLAQFNDANAKNLLFEFFMLWNNCYVEHLHFHFGQAQNNLLPLIMNWFNKNDTVGGLNQSSLPIIEFGTKQNAKIEIFCLHIMPDSICYREQLMSTKIIQANFDDSMKQKQHFRIEQSNIIDNIISNNNNCSDFEKVLSSSSSSSLLPPSTSANKFGNNFSLKDSPKTLLPFDEWECIFSLIKHLAMALNPIVYTIFMPFPNDDSVDEDGNQLLVQLLATLTPLFPMSCCHIDVQLNATESKMNSLSSSSKAALINFIFTNANFAKKLAAADDPSPTPQWRHILRRWHDKQGECALTGCCEYAFSAFALHPVHIDADFLKQNIKHFIGLDFTDHLIGRRIHFYIGPYIESFADKEVTEGDKMCDNWWADNINEQFHAEWRALIESKERMTTAFANTPIRSPRHGEYLVRNELTGLQMCIQFVSHRWE